MRKTLPDPAIFLVPGGGPTLSLMGIQLAYKLCGDQTQGRWALLEQRLPPQFREPPLHWHQVTHQAFYVLEGSITFRLGTQFFTAQPGAFISVPPGTQHTFANPHLQAARLLVILVPSGIEDLCKELSALVQTDSDVPAKPDRLRELGRRFDTFGLETYPDQEVR